MGEQLHKRISEEQVKMIVDRYIKKELMSLQAMNLLGLKRSQFFELVNKYNTEKHQMVLPLNIAVRGATEGLTR